MAEVSKNLLTVEERDELRKKVEEYFLTILALAKRVEQSLDSIKRLDAIDFDAVFDLRLEFVELSQCSENTERSMSDFLDVLNQRMSEEETEVKFKIRYEDTMTSYLLDETFDSEEEAYQFIDENFFEGDLQFYEVEVAQ